MDDPISNFQPHPEVAITSKLFDPAIHKAAYRFDYQSIFRDIQAKQLPERDALAQLIKEDLFFIVHMVMGIPKANHPFIVNQCRLVESGPQTGTIDIWSREHFKAIDVNEPVLTPKGFVPHGDLVPGDRVFTPDGNLTPVVAKTRVFTDADCFRVSFNDGYQVVCSGEHLWKVERRSKKRVKGSNKRIYRETIVMDAASIAEYGFSPDRRLSVRVNKPLVYKTARLSLPPYAVGVWLGDGNSDSARFTSAYADSEILSFLYDEGIVTSERTSINANTGLYQLGEKGHRSLGFACELRKMGILGNKHIPETYHRGSICQRLSLLQGLMDTDGTCDTRGTATFCNKSEVLASDVFRLATGLGLNPRMRKHYSQVNGEPYPFYQVSFQAYKDFPPFRLSRKLARCKNGTRLARRFITGCERVPSAPVSCIQVGREDGMYLVGKNLVPTHNSTIITVGLTVKRIINNPECTTAIFSYKKPAAEKFLDSIRKVLELPIMKHVFPSILYDNPSTQSPSWSLQGGIRVKRQSASRKEHTVEAFGLIEGMPTGIHADHRIYDDVETDDLASSPDQLDLCYRRFEMSRNLGSDGGTEQIIGTYYSHNGVLVRLGDKLDYKGDKMYDLRIFPATVDGTITGDPVFFSQEYLDSKKTDSTFSTQQLCNPTPSHEIKLRYERFNVIKRSELPENRIKLVIIDPAGDKDVMSGSKNDRWAMLCVSVKPTMDDLGLSQIYIEDAIIGQMGSSESQDAACTIYTRNGRIAMLGVERVGTDSAWLHVKNALAAKGRYLDVKKPGRFGGNLMLLSPANRSKNKKISDNLEWPLNNGKLHIVDDLDESVLDEIKNECHKFPFFHVDILDALAYTYDILADPEFIFLREDRRIPAKKKSRFVSPGSA